MARAALGCTLGAAQTIGIILLMKDFLQAAAGYVPLMQSLVWLIFLLILALLYRRQITDFLKALKRRIDSGAEFKVAGLEVGKLVTKTADLTDEVKTYGNPDQLKVLFKAQGNGWKKSTKALNLPNGCLIQVTTERRNSNGDWTNSEAVTFVPDVRLQESEGKTYQVVAK